MPFRVEIGLEAKDARMLWAGAIHTYLGVSDSFKITFRNGDLSAQSRSEVMFSVINKTRTSLMTTRFTQEFFNVFRMEGELPGRADVRDEENIAPSYSLWVNTKEMDVLFKDCGEDAESWKVLLICGDEIVQQVYSNKMFVEFKTRAQITKRYSVNYQQGYSNFDGEIRYRYYNTLKNQNEGGITQEGAKVHRLALNPFMIKGFLHMFPATLEDFKIQVFPNRGEVHLVGFNRDSLFSTAAHADRPMTLKIVVKLEDIIFSNVEPHKSGGSEYSFAVSFKLKDFKSFVQLISSNLSKFSDGANLNSMGGGSDKAVQRWFSGNNKPVIDITFTSAGEPVVFERCYFLDRENEMVECCRVNLTEITDSEGHKMVLDGIKQHSVVASHNMVDADPPTSDSPIINEPLFVPSQEEASTSGTASTPVRHSYRAPQKRKLMEIPEDTDFEDQDDYNESQSDMDDAHPYLGPTQGVDSALRGIFD